MLGDDLLRFLPARAPIDAIPPIAPMPMPAPSPTAAPAASSAPASAASAAAAAAAAPLRGEKRRVEDIGEESKESQQPAAKKSKPTVEFTCPVCLDNFDLHESKDTVRVLPCSDFI